MPGDDLLRAQLLALADAAGTDTSPARQRQLRWVAGELHRYALTLASTPTLAQMFTPVHIQEYVHAAASGELKVRRRSVVHSPAAVRVRLDCVRLLAAAGMFPDPQVQGAAWSAPASRIPERQARDVAAAAEDAIGRTRHPAAAVRHALVLSLVADARLRVGELAALDVDDLDVINGQLTFTPRSPASTRPSEPVTVPVSARTVRLARRWLTERERLTVLAPRSRALFVSVRGNHSGTGVHRPAGLPLQPRGLARAHHAAAALLNDHQATEHLVPGTLGRLRPVPVRQAASEAEVPADAR